MMDSDGSCMTKEKEIALEDDIKFYCINICKTLAMENPDIPEDQKDFFEGGECAGFLDEYFDDSVDSKLKTISASANGSMLESWLKHVSVFLDNKYLTKKSPYIALSLLAERQATIACCESYTPEIKAQSERLYDILKAKQFCKVLDGCRQTDKNYLGTLEQKV